MIKIKIKGTGSYLPEMKISNQDMSKIVETNDEWIQSRTGITYRHYSSGEATWEMGTIASQRALADAGVDAAEIGMIILTSVTPDYITPPTASIIQAEIKATNSYCFDLNGACSGFIYAYDLAAHYLASSNCKYILLVSSETLSKFINFEDRNTCILFGDGAAALVLERSGADETSAFLASDLGGQAEGAENLLVKGFEINHPFLPETLKPERFPNHTPGHKIFMVGAEVFKFAVQSMSKSVKEACAKADLKIKDIDFLIPHQANSRIIQAATKRLKIDPEKVIDRLADFGNISSATIPTCLDQLAKEGKLKRGHKVVLAGFGGGLTYGAIVLIY